MEKGGILVHGLGGGRVVRLPPGFRFHPTDDELVVQYLRRKVFGVPQPANVIPDVELSRFAPWDLPEGGVATGTNEKDRYFFNLRESKYRKGSRTNRASGSGYWKATGRDKQITFARGNQVVGIKKFLVFYRGKPPHGTRTDWVMHEYYYVTGPQDNALTQRKNPPTDTEGWVLCHIFEKKRAERNEEPEPAAEPNDGFIDFLGRNEAIVSPVPRSPVFESSCLTELTDEPSSEEEGGCNSPPACTFLSLR